MFSFAYCSDSYDKTDYGVQIGSRRHRVCLEVDLSFSSLDSCWQHSTFAAAAARSPSPLDRQLARSSSLEVSMKGREGMDMSLDLETSRVATHLENSGKISFA